MDFEKQKFKIANKKNIKNDTGRMKKLTKLTKEIISIFYFFCIIISTILFFIQYNTPSSMLIILCLLILFNIIFSILNIENNICFAIFNVSFFTLLVGKYLIGLISNRNWYEPFSENTITTTLTLLFISLITISLCVFICNYILQLKKPSLLQKKSKENNKSLTLAAGIFFISILAISTIVMIEKVLYVQTNNYLSIYTDNFQKLPSIFYKLSTLLTASFCFFLCTKPPKKTTILSIIIYLSYLVLTIFSGVRGDFVTGIMLLFIYIIIRHFQEPDEKWITKKRILVLVIFGITAISFLGAYNQIRNGNESSKDFIENIVQFFDDQGGSSKVISYSIDYQDQLPNTNITYSLGPIVTRSRYGTIAKILKIPDGQPDITTKTGAALYGNNLGATISYLVLKDAYQQGGGLGTQYIAELYIDFGVIGIILYSILFGISMAILTRLLKHQNWILASISLVTLAEMIYIPRQSSINWLINLTSILRIITILIIIMLTKIIDKNTTKKQNQNKKDSQKTHTLQLQPNNSKKILWTTNVIFPYPAKQIGQKIPASGGWLLGLFDTIKNKKNFELAIASVYNGKKLQKFKNKNITYYLLPSKLDVIYQSKLEKYWKAIINDFQPDLIHLHGTEYAHNLALQNICPNEKYLVSIQGLLEPCSKAYLAGLSKKEILKNTTLNTMMLRGINQGKKQFHYRAKYEKQILKKATVLTGRTKWDYDESLKIAGKKPYYKCNEILREGFYGENWNPSEIEPHSIYISQASYPIKGFHVLLETLPELTKKYPDIKIYVAGTNILDKSSIKKKLLFSEYAKLIESRIKKYNLSNYIEFIGEIPEKKVLEYMKKTNIFVQCSSIENSSNSLGEAMLIGMPCVASNVGGTSDLLKDKEEGLLYKFGDKKELAKCIDKIFSNDKLATKLGKKAQKHAKITHDRKKNSETMLKIYNEVINGEN